MHIGIVGHGYVGKATKLFESSSVCVSIYDIDIEKRYPHQNINLEYLAKHCNLIFVCVPTPMDVDDEGKCHIGIVEEVVNTLIDRGYNKHNIVVRSTVPVGTCDQLGVNFMPEFLTEKNWKSDVQNCKDWIVGCNSNNQFIAEIYDLFYMAQERGGISKDYILHFVTTMEAEMTKYVRNCFLATKVSFFNEMAQFCDQKGISYNKVRELTVLDSRVGPSHTFVPGPDGHGNGFGGHCLPKDLSSLCYQMKKCNVTPLILNTVQDRNNNVDRINKDWKEMTGRAVI